MTQTKKQTAIETFCDVGAGFVISWGLTFTVLPLWGFQASVVSATEVTLIYTVAALARKYIVRRVFNMRIVKKTA